MLPSLEVVVVNWNSGRLLRDCLASVCAVHDPRFELRRIIVVDNASSDGSAEGLEQLDPRVEVLQSGRNLGFAAACNRGAAGSTADVLLFLNPDTRVTADALARPVQCLAARSSRHIGIAGVRLVDDEGATSRSCARFPTPAMFTRLMLGLDRLSPERWPSHFMREWDHRDTRQVDHVCGAFYVVRRQVFQSLGGFDERFFLYLEDLDFSRRAALHGWSTMFFAGAVVYHYGGGASQAVRGRRLGDALHSRILYGYKHFPWRSATALALGTLCVEPPIRMADALGRLDRRDMAAVLVGCAWLWRRVLGDLCAPADAHRWRQAGTDSERHG